MTKPLRPLSEYSEDMGAVLWWKLPVDEPPYVGSPNDAGYPVEVTLEASDGSACRMTTHVGGWPGYHTHFQQIDIPEIE